MEDLRITPEEAFFLIAEVASRRSTCLRAKVGAVLVKDNGVIATGYNGAERGAVHCTEIGCFLVEGHCERAIHAEINAICQSAKRGVCTKGAVLYSTHKPCRKCSSYLRASGVMKHFWLQDYKDREEV